MSRYNESISISTEGEEVTVVFSFQHVVPDPSSSSSRHNGDLHRAFVNLLGNDNVMKSSINHTDRSVPSIILCFTICVTIL